MDQYAAIELETSVLAPGAYTGPKLFLRDTDNAFVNEEFTDPSFWVTEPDYAYILDSNLGYPLLVAKAEGSTWLCGRGVLGGNEYDTCLSITITNDWTYNVQQQLDLELPACDRFYSPFAKFSGIKKGRKRVVADPEPRSSHEVMLYTVPPGVSALEPAGSKFYGNLRFDKTVFRISKTTGYGYWYGWRYGQVEDIRIF